VGLPVQGTDQLAVETNKMRWQEWWLRNQWSVIRVENRRLKTSASDEDAGEVSPARKRLLGFLLRQMGNDYWDVRAAAALALGKSGLCSTEIRKSLEKALKDRHADVQESAALALGMLQSSQSSYLLRSLLANRRADRGLRASAALALGLIGDQANAQVLANVARHEAKDEVRAAAVTSLGLLGDESAAKTLLGLFQGSEEGRIRAIAVTSLGKLGIRHFRLYPKARSLDFLRVYENRLLDKRTQVHVRQSLATILGRLGDEATVRVLKRVVLNDRQQAVRAMALLSLGKMAIRAKAAQDERGAAGIRQFLRKILKREKYAAVRAYAALAAGLTRDIEAAPLLREVFASSRHGDVHAAAALALGLVGDAESLPRLAEEIRKPRSAGDVRRFACIAIGLIGRSGHPKAGEYLRGVLEKVNVPYLRWSAAMGLAILGDRSSLKLLKKNLSDGSLITREAAIRAIGYFRDESSVGTLIDGFEREKSRDVQAMYVVSLGYIVDISEEVPAFRRVSEDFNWLAATKYPSIDFLLRVF
jgi:HEAT repeat protein